MCTASVLRLFIHILCLLSKSKVHMPKYPGNWCIFTCYVYLLTLTVSNIDHGYWLVLEVFGRLLGYVCIPKCIESCLKWFCEAQMSSKLCRSHNTTVHSDFSSCNFVTGLLLKVVYNGIAYYCCQSYSSSNITVESWSGVNSFIVVLYHS